MATSMIKNSSENYLSNLDMLASFSIDPNFTIDEECFSQNGRRIAVARQENGDPVTSTSSYSVHSSDSEDTLSACSGDHMDKENRSPILKIIGKVSKNEPNTVYCSLADNSKIVKKDNPKRSIKNCPHKAGVTKNVSRQNFKRNYKGPWKIKESVKRKGLPWGDANNTAQLKIGNSTDAISKKYERTNPKIKITKAIKLNLQNTLSENQKRKTKVSSKICAVKSFQKVASESDIIIPVFDCKPLEAKKVESRSPPLEALKKMINDLASTTGTLTEPCYTANDNFPIIYSKYEIPDSVQFLEKCPMNVTSPNKVAVESTMSGLFSSRNILHGTTFSDTACITDDNSSTKIESRGGLRRNSKTEKTVYLKEKKHLSCKKKSANNCSSKNTSVNNGNKPSNSNNNSKKVVAASKVTGVPKRTGYKFTKEIDLSIKRKIKKPNKFKEEAPKLPLKLTLGPILKDLELIRKGISEIPMDAEINNLIVCICDDSEEDGEMVECDYCQTWQHCKCLNLEVVDPEDKHMCWECRYLEHGENSEDEDYLEWAFKKTVSLLMYPKCE